MLPVRTLRCGFDGGFPATFRSLSRDLDSFFGRTTDFPGPVRFNVDIRQDGDDLVVEADVPGLTKDDLEITVEDNVLTISGEYKNATEDKQGSYHIRERRYGKFERSWTLPKTADGEKVSAGLTNGVLTLRIPTREEAKPRRIEVK
jgi:HSP20 family protein